MCKRKSADQIKGRTGGVRDTPQIKMKAAWDV